jgi:hypothetical protein
MGTVCAMHGVAWGVIMGTSSQVGPGPGWQGFLSSSARERRAGLRVWIDLPVEVPVDGYRHRCRVVEASPIGMVVALTRALAVRDPPLVGTYEIHVSPSRVLRVQARTVWRRGATQAVRFVGLTEDDRKAVDEMVWEALRLESNDVDRIDLAERRDHQEHRER